MGEGPDGTHRLRRPPPRRPPSCWRRPARGARGRRCRPSAGRAAGAAPARAAGAPGTRRSAPAAPEPRRRPPRATTPTPRPTPRPLQGPQSKPRPRRRRAYRRPPSPRSGPGCSRRLSPPPPRPLPPRPPFTRRRGRPGGEEGLGPAAQAQTRSPPTAGSAPPLPPRGRRCRAPPGTPPAARGALPRPGPPRPARAAPPPPPATAPQWPPRPRTRATRPAARRAPLAERAVAGGRDRNNWRRRRRARALAGSRPGAEPRRGLRTRTPVRTRLSGFRPPLPAPPGQVQGKGRGLRDVTPVWGRGARAAFKARSPPLRRATSRGSARSGRQAPPPPQAPPLRRPVDVTVIARRGGAETWRGGGPGRGAGVPIPEGRAVQIPEAVSYFYCFLKCIFTDLRRGGRGREKQPRRRKKTPEAPGTTHHPSPRTRRTGMQPAARPWAFRAHRPTLTSQPHRPALFFNLFVV